MRDEVGNCKQVALSRQVRDGDGLGVTRGREYCYGKDVVWDGIGMVKLLWWGVGLEEVDKGKFIGQGGKEWLEGMEVNKIKGLSG